MNDRDRSNFLPTASIENLKLRAKLLQRVRRFFLDRGYLEVDTPVLSRDTVVDCYIDPIGIQLATGGNEPDEFWLQTSPEFAMKRLLVAGMESIFQITRAFRNGECGAQHNTEFTIVEWYQVGQSYADGRAMLGELISKTLDVPPPIETSYSEAFIEYANIAPLTCSIDELEQSAVAHDVVVPESMNRADRDEWLNVLLTSCVEPRLGIVQPTILYDYPASQSALARIDDSRSVPVAQRFEVYFRGIELANGYHELCDADELRRRNEFNNTKRRADNRDVLPTDSYLLSAMDHGLPDCTGVAMGFDRLVMLAANANHIEEVIPFSIAQA